MSDIDDDRSPAHLMGLARLPALRHPQQLPSRWRAPRLDDTVEFFNLATGVTRRLLLQL
jgi:hypothetical protein